MGVNLRGQYHGSSPKLGGSDLNNELERKSREFNFPGELYKKTRKLTLHRKNNFIS